MANKARTEIYEARGGEWRWRYRAKNGKIVASGEGYVSRSSVKRGVRRLGWSMAIAPIVEIKPAHRNGDY